MATRLIYQGKKFKLVSKDIATSHGKSTYEIVDHPGAVVILPFLDNDTIVMIRNMRYSIDKAIIELPAGTLEHKEDILTCAQRELEEETGYAAATWDYLFDFYASPGFCNEILHVFVAKDLELHQQNLDDNEKIDVVTLSLSKALSMIQQKEIVDAKTIATLLYYTSFVKK